jgi:hypothetical protein
VRVTQVDGRAGVCCQFDSARMRRLPRARLVSSGDKSFCARRHPAALLLLDDKILNPGWFRRLQETPKPTTRAFVE